MRIRDRERVNDSERFDQGADPAPLSGSLENLLERYRQESPSGRLHLWLFHRRLRSELEQAGSFWGSGEPLSDDPGPESAGEPPLDLACCGIYCPDCLRLDNRFSGLARELIQELEKDGLDDYATAKQDQDRRFAHYPIFAEVLAALAEMSCAAPCRKGGGCSGVRCRIMICAEERGFSGCWLCPDLAGCGHFAALEPLCGDGPGENLRLIREHGFAEGLKRRGPLYRWQRKP